MALARARRQIEVFDIAIVAVVTKALGAFIVLVIMLLPYYRSDPTNAPVVQAVEDYLGETRRAIEAAEREAANVGGDRAALENLFQRAKDSVEKAQGIVQAIRDKLDQAKAQIDRLEARDREVQEQLAKADAELNQARGRIAQLQSEKDGLAQSNRTLAADNSRLQGQTQSLQQQIASLNQDVARLNEQNEALSQQNKNTESDMENLRQRALKAEDPSLVMRWFSVELAITDCADVDFVLYVRWEGRLRNAYFQTEMPEPSPFAAAHPEQRTPLLGHRYFDVGARNDTSSLGGKALEQEGFLALARTQTQFKIFQAVSRAEGDYSVYVSAKDPQALRQRQCAIYPYYLSWGGATLGQKIVLNQKRPFAWLRRFRIKKDGSNTIALDPKDDDQFRSDLDEFSRSQSDSLCKERRICGTEDAYLFALQASRSH